jgi:hypothetical protein
LNYGNSLRLKAGVTTGYLEVIPAVQDDEEERRNRLYVAFHENPRTFDSIPEDVGYSPEESKGST